MISFKFTTILQSSYGKLTSKCYKGPFNSLYELNYGFKFKNKEKTLGTEIIYTRGIFLNKNFIDIKIPGFRFVSRIEIQKIYLKRHLFVASSLFYHNIVMTNNTRWFHSFLLTDASSRGVSS